MARKEKLGTPRGVSQWRNLETAGDCKRLFKWLIHSLRDGTLDSRNASVMALIGSYLLKAVEVADLEGQLAALKRKMDAVDVNETQNRNTTH